MQNMWNFFAFLMQRNGTFLHLIVVGLGFSTQKRVSVGSDGTLFYFIICISLTMVFLSIRL